MPLRLGRRTFGDDELVIMAIVNRTPDSFYDRGATYALGAALGAVDRAVAAGAAIVDVGGVKAGPGDEVDAAEELRRTAEVVAAVRRAHPELVISVDTWRAEVGRVLVAEGADLLNDTWGGVDPGLAEVAAATGAGLVCAHAGGQQPRTRPHRVAYADVVADVVATVTGLAERAVALGVRRDGVLIDPAHDFGKNTRHSLEVTRRLGELVGDRLAGAGLAVPQGLRRRDPRPAAGRPAGGHARGHRGLRLAGRPGLPRPRRHRHPPRPRHRRRHPRHPPPGRRPPRPRLIRRPAGDGACRVTASARE